MGTRGITGVVAGQVEKVAYNQYDSYPEGMGWETLKKLRSVVKQGKINDYKCLALHARLVSDKDKPTKAEIEKLKKYADTSVSSGDLEEWYVLLRNLQGSLFDSLKAGYIHDHKSFILDSLYCEWGYIVNLDEEVFEVYTGFQTKPHNKGRYAKLLSETFEKTKKTLGGTGYYPCALVKTYSFDCLPDRKQFLKDMADIAEENKEEEQNVYKILEKVNETKQKCEVCKSEIPLGAKILIAGEVVSYMTGDNKEETVWNTWGKCCSKECVDTIVNDEYDKKEKKEEQSEQNY